ncbi:two component, sigma54 specific, transcriptional regulator, Fis family [Desulfarculus baarsii DSM 2075]|uniref:Two component, sigma54 specific, transcriptional regulator, Fis family n=1 Tax=Desulfarculus baarsii (strain ATCC 33931 / DSM 2075 / LMG 7858 / VKM B-1802 / 2st14) TaxID=644282 RepID=E1QH65_DESB2|nr:sigma-54 dependent transcriptional regulator [Desulfarculus baarsii]ADK84908.1 two component, sigma54 specific, transcriptional regulator, Fis family [Desulfarculus baarsii DSM 2075]
MSARQQTVLVVDDERGHRLMLRAHLEDAGYRVIDAADGEAALVQLESEPVELVLMDQVMPRMDGLSALKRVKAQRPELPVLMMTAFGSIDNAVTALKEGADDYLTKPLDVEEVLIKVGRRLEQARLARQVEEQARRLGERFDFSALIGESHPMLRLKESLALVAPTQATVLITGESGTGKEVAAQILHQHSKRAKGPLVGVNCAALPESLLESELFGHEKGSFTGATARRDGRFKTADGGTLFLDEVGEMSPSTQAKLLRVLQDGEYSPVGSDKVYTCDVRVIAATNRDLQQAVRDSEFREDLFYRLNVINIEMPPLRQRGEDIMLLADHFLRRFAAQNQRRLGGFGQNARLRMLAYRWPGNVRELINAVERAVIMSRGPQVELEDLPSSLQSQPAVDQMLLRPGLSVRQAEKTLIILTLEATAGNRTQAAQMLGITRKTLQNKIKEYEAEGERLP